MTSSSSDLTEEIEDLQEQIIALQVQIRHQKNELNATRTRYEKLNNKLIHNLKNPIGAAYSFSEMILESVDEYDAEKLQKHVKIINASTKFSIALLRHYARYLDSFKEPDDWKMEQFCLRDLVTQNIAKLQEIEPFQSVVHQDKTEQLVFANHADIQEVIDQAIANAVRFSAAGTQIESKFFETSEELCLSIIDNGNGIAEEHIHRLTEPFYCIETYDSKQMKCIGLGLALANNLIIRNKGSMDIKSTVNEGTTVTLKLKKS